MPYLAHHTKRGVNSDHFDTRHGFSILSFNYFIGKMVMHNPKFDQCIAKYVLNKATMGFKSISDAPLCFEPQHAGPSRQFLFL